jgi:hypothetical protein
VAEWFKAPAMKYERASCHLVTSTLFFVSEFRGIAAPVHRLRYIRCYTSARLVTLVTDVPSRSARGIGLNDLLLAPDDSRGDWHRPLDRDDVNFRNSVFELYATQIPINIE